MRRHRALQPLSREHHNGLLCVRRLMQSADADAEVRKQAIRDFRQLWVDEFAEHLLQEERWLAPVITPVLRRRLREEHQQIRDLANAAIQQELADDPPSDWVRRLADMLRDHIRWEERELFPAIEKSSSQEELNKIEAALREVDARRSRSCQVRPWAQTSSS